MHSLHEMHKRAACRRGRLDAYFCIETAEQMLKKFDIGVLYTMLQAILIFMNINIMEVYFHQSHLKMLGSIQHV
jgi:hypothetical protein